MSDARRLRLEVVLQAVDRATAPIRSLMRSNNDLAKSVKATRTQLKDLERATGLTNQFEKLRAGMGETASALKNARERVQQLGQAIQKAEAPSAKLSQQMRKASSEATRLTDKYKAQQAQLAEVRGKLQEAGRGTMTMAQYQERLRSATTSATRALEEQDARLKAHNSRVKAQFSAQQSADRMRARAGNLASAGVGATAAGMAAGVPLMKGVDEAKHYELEKLRIGALGMGDKSTQEALAFAKNLQAYGVSQVEKAELMRDAMSVFADTHHAEMVMPTLAKMKFANGAVFGQADGAENERKFLDMLKAIELRGGLASEAAFKRQADMIQRVITATGGRVQADEWLNVIKRGGLAAKSMDNEAFYYTLEPIVQEMGGNTVGTAMMSAYQNLYQGKTTKRALRNLDNLGLIEDRSKVKEDKVGQVSFMDPGALKGAELFRRSQFEWVEKVLLPTLAAKGITEQNQIMDAVGSIFSNRTASNLISQMILQRDQIHKNVRLNQGAANIDQLDAQARSLPQGKELETLSKVHDLEKSLGETVLPLYASALEWVASAAAGITKFMQDNPTLAKVLAVSVGVLAAAFLVLGPAMLAIASVLGPYAMLHVIFAKLGVTGGVAGGAMRALAGGFNLAMRACARLSSGAMMAGKAFLWLGRLFLTNPIGLAITAIALAAYLIYRYWEPISAFFLGLWGQVKEAFNGGILGVLALLMNWSPLGQFYAAFAPVLRWFGFDVPDKFSEFGANMMRGLADGIQGAIRWVMDAVDGVAGGAIAKFKTLLGIHSPSRVFAELGGFTMAGLGEGLTRGQAGPLQAMQKVATGLTSIGAGIAIGTAPAVAAPLRFDTRPPLTMAAGGGSAAPAGAMTITINIYQQPGQNANDLARAIRNELQQLDNQRAARARSRLTDRD